ncbi:hypothetical protein D777_02897 [Marinobacter nitratireducens]|uniref:Uncharacterized protein n=1 Tax=Marinobacter nitratireducens TaxID=1137280 RepID=A0A072MY34_9GAMM|nr:hypothetical protein D777_02897 [Marinobacter nitratireducens]
MRISEIREKPDDRANDGACSHAVVPFFYACLPCGGKHHP